VARHDILKVTFRVWLLSMIGDVMWGIRFMGQPVAREKDSERCHGFVWSQDEVTIAAWTHQTCRISELVLFVSKQTNVSEQP
jgi:hypothetical protein